MVSLVHKNVDPKNLLSNKKWLRRFFDANNKQDLLEYQYFEDNDRWRNGCPFEIEWPHLNARDMIRAKIVEAHLESIIKNAK